MPTALMKPTITADGTKRRSAPKRRTPATIIAAPVRTDRVNNARWGSGLDARSVSATMSAIAPVACTAMNGVLVTSAPPTVP